MTESKRILQVPASLLEDAPHSENCIWYAFHEGCNCWKAVALLSMPVSLPTRESVAETLWDSVQNSAGHRYPTAWAEAKLTRPSTVSSFYAEADAVLALLSRSTPHESGFYCEEDDPADIRPCTCPKGQEPPASRTWHRG